MLAIRHTVCVLLVLPLLLGGCGGDGADDGDKPRPPAGGGVILRLKVAAGESGMRWDWSGEPRALVNGVARTVGFDADGVPVVGADVSADGLYTVHFPADAYSRAKRAFVLPPAQFPVSGGSLQAAACPMYGTVRTTGDAADVTLSPLCGVVRIPLAGDAHIASVRVEDRSGGAVSGLFPFDPATPEIVRNGNFGNLPWVVLDCAGTGGGVRPAASGTEFCVAVPAGDYASGLSVRVTDCAHRSATWDIPGPCAVAAGGVKTLAPLNYAPGEDLLFAEHFDNCVWGCEVDGMPVDVDVATGTDISQSVQGVTRTAVLLRAAKLTSGVWHQVRMSFGAVAAGSAFRFMPTVIRDVKNCFWIDDVEVRRTGRYAHAGDCVTVEPTTERAAAGEDVSRLRLRPSAVLSMANETTYTVTPGYGMTWICPSLSSDESVWTRDIAFAEKQLAANGCKVWCIHLPYGSTTAARNRDLCAAGADRAASVAFFTRAIRAVAPLKPKNVLVHCNQTLAFGDGSSAASLALSLHELQTVADEIGAHVCVENMSYGVGADAAVLAAAVDEANALGSHRYEVRIAFDTGHANLYLTREQPGKTVVDWLRTAGARIGQLHIHGNRGWNGRINDDHLMPGYAGRLGYADAIGRAGLWGEFYHTLLAECRYRGPFTYEISTRTFGTVAGEERSDNVSAPWTIAHNYDTYLYPAFREYANRK